MSVPAAEIPTLAIFNQSHRAKNAFVQLLSAVKDQLADDSKRTKIQPRNIQDLLDKFALWTGSLGALQSNKLSLDYRLHDAPDIQEQICEYLENLLEAVQDCE